MEKKIVIIPTYNEIGNIKAIIESIFALNADLHVLVVDDNSPDGTAALVEALKGHFPLLNILVREKKNGLGKAYIAGFKWAMSRAFDIIFEMDADFSHRPADLLRLVNEIENGDVVVGSRYVQGGSTVNWGFVRKLISRGGSLYAKLILHYPLKDWTGGFNGWRANVLQSINLDSVKSEGYSFQIELKYKALKKGFKVIESPIVFEERRVGTSKMSFGILLEAFYKIWMIKYSN